MLTGLTSEPELGSSAMWVLSFWKLDEAAISLYINI